MEGKLVLTLKDNIHGEVAMEPDRKLLIDAPVGCGGSGKSFSPMDVFLASYASCVTMAMEIVAKRTGFSISGTRVQVSAEATKTGDDPHIQAVDAVVFLPKEYTAEQLTVLEQAAHRCPIHNSLRKDTKKTLEFKMGSLKECGDSKTSECQCA